MKKLSLISIVAILLLSITNTYTQETNKLTECLIVSGTFNQSTEIWKQRWQLYDNTITNIIPSSITNVLGYYARQPYTINKHKCYKQINGNQNNYIWFGHQLSPINSFDVWYIGNTIQPPNQLATLTQTPQLSIPCTPTFLPNRNGYSTLTIFYATNLTSISDSDPSIQRVYLSQTEIENMANLVNSEVNNAISKIFIDTINNQLTITVKIASIPSTIDIYRSNDLINDEFILIYSNIVLNSSSFSFILPINGNIGFYKVVYR